MKFLLKLLPNCKDVNPLQSRALDERLGFRDRFRIALHILICPACRDYAKQLQQMKSWWGRLEEESPWEEGAEKPSEELTNRWQEAVKKAQAE